MLSNTALLVLPMIADGALFGATGAGAGASADAGVEGGLEQGRRAIDQKG